MVRNRVFIVANRRERGTGNEENGNSLCNLPVYERWHIVFKWKSIKQIFINIWGKKRERGLGI